MERERDERGVDIASVWSSGAHRVILDVMGPSLSPGRARWLPIASVVLVGIALMASGAAAALWWTPEKDRATTPRASAGPPAPTFPGGKDTPSNILPEDYVGPSACGSCHKKNYRAWLEHPHRRMNQLVSDEAVAGDFEGRVVETGDGTARFDHPAPGEFLLTFEGTGRPRRVYRITRTIGSRIKQFYAGLLVEGEPFARNRPDDEVVVPFGWWIHERRWMPINYFDEDNDVVDDGTADVGKWPKDVAIRKVCVFCHNTYAYLHRLGDGARLTGFARHEFVIDAPTLRTELAKHVDLGDIAGFPLLSRPRFALESQLVTVGISCETCHFGTRAHAENDADYRFGPSSPHVALRPSDRTHSSVHGKENPWIVNGICNQCHCSDGESYPDGSSKGNSREATELASGACASKIACTHCHNPHVAGPLEEGGPDNPRQVASCTGCHAEYAHDGAAQAHARHRPTDASCLDCHMPRITQGISRMVRSHRISVPVDPRMLAAGAPNACNACHADKSAAWTIRELQRLWNRRIDSGPDWAQRWGGSLDTPAMDAWEGSSSPNLKAVLVDVLARRHDVDSMARLVTLLDDPRRTTRALAWIALQRRVGRSLGVDEIDVAASSARRKQQIERLRSTLFSPR